MAHFRGTLRGNRGQASRLGSKASGLTVNCNGWNCGVTIEAHYDDKIGEDTFFIYLTSGSDKSHRHNDLLGVVIGSCLTSIRNKNELRVKNWDRKE